MARLFCCLYILFSFVSFIFSSFKGRTICFQLSISQYSITSVSGNVSFISRAKSPRLGDVEGEIGPQCRAAESYSMSRPVFLRVASC